jgi:hypothetical protein
MSCCSIAQAKSYQKYCHLFWASLSFPEVAQNGKKSPNLVTLSKA